MSNILESQILGLEALVAALGGADNWSIRDQRIVDSWVRNQVGLELVQVNVQGTIETERTGDRGDDLSDESVEMLERWSWDIEVTAADIVDSFVINQESTITVFNCAVGGENCVVRLNNSGGNPRSWVDSKLKLRLLAIVGGEALEEERTETRTSSTTEGVENQETLKGRAVVLYNVSAFHPNCFCITGTHQNPTNLIQSTIQDLLSDSVVTSSVVVGGILLTTDQQLWVEELAVITSSNLVDWRRVQIDKDGTGDIFAAASFCEDSVEFTRGMESLSVGIWATILQQTVFEEIPGREISVSAEVCVNVVANLIVDAGFDRGR